MGLFDYVTASHPQLVCSEGHPIRTMQTKDAGCTMGDLIITGELYIFKDGGWGHRHPSEPPLSATGTREIAVYGDCEACPAFIQADTLNLCEHTVDFRITLRDGRVISIERTSPGLAEWLEQTPLKPHMAACWGPMSYADAMAMHVDGFRPHRPWRWDQPNNIWGAP